jgi:hypothetical protein
MFNHHFITHPQRPDACRSQNTRQKPPLIEGSRRDSDTGTEAKAGPKVDLRQFLAVKKTKICLGLSLE